MIFTSFGICKTFKAFKITFLKNKTKPATEKHTRFYLELFSRARDLNLSDEGKL